MVNQGDSDDDAVATTAVTPFTLVPSIKHVLRDHCRERLIVVPYLWTDRHLEILDCTFVSGHQSTHWLAQPLLSQCRPTPSAIASVTSDTNSGGDCSEKSEEMQILATSSSHEARCIRNAGIRGDARRLAGYLDPLSRRQALARLLSIGALKPDLQRISIDLCFGNDEHCIRSSIPCLVIGSHYPHRSAEDIFKGMPANNDELLFPAIIWLDYWFDIQKHREDHYRKPRRYNKPIAAVRRIRLRQVTPSNPHEDPYIIAALIALAQAQWDWEQKTWMRKKPTNTQKLSLDINKTFKVRMIIGNCQSPHALQLYTADVPASVIKRFAKPSKELRTQTPVGMKIMREEIETNPTRTLRRRLLHALFAVDPEANETKAEQGDGTQGAKRGSGEGLDDSKDRDNHWSLEVESDAKKR